MTPDQIISFDPYVMAFIKNNVVTIGMFLAMLKAWAKATPSVLDDKIYTMLSSVLGSLLPGKKMKEIKTAEEKTEKIIETAKKATEDVKKV